MKSVLLFLANGFEAYEASVFTDVMGWSRACGNEPISLVTTGLRKQIKCTWNFNVIPEMDFENIKISEFDALAVPGGFENAGFYEDAYDEKFLNLIRQFNEQKKFIATVCVGALPLGKSGILKNRKATTYDITDEFGSRKKQLSDFGANIINEKIVIDENIITSTGPAAALDVAFALLEKLTDKNNVAVVRKYMRFE